MLVEPLAGVRVLPEGPLLPMASSSTRGRGIVLVRLGLQDRQVLTKETLAKYLQQRHEEAVQEEMQDEHTTADRIGKIVLDHLGLMWDQVAWELCTLRSLGHHWGRFLTWPF
jgi:hypothetical protein